MIKLTTNLSSVVCESWKIRNTQKIIERIGTTGTNGHLNFLGISGCCLLRIITDSARNIIKVPVN
jgi:hypothetical protein